MVFPVDTHLWLAMVQKQDSLRREVRVWLTTTMSQLVPRSRTLTDKVMALLPTREHDRAEASSLCTQILQLLCEHRPSQVVY